MYVIKLKHSNFKGKDEITDKEYQKLPHNLRQYYKKVQDEDDEQYEDEKNNQYVEED